MTGRALPTIAIFDSSNVEDLAAHLQSLLAEDAAEAPGNQPGRPAPTADPAPISDSAPLGSPDTTANSIPTPTGSPIPTPTGSPTLTPTPTPTGSPIHSPTDSPTPTPGMLRQGAYSSVFQRAIELGKTVDFLDFLDKASLFRPDFREPSDLGAGPEPVRITSGDSGPALVCLPGFIGMPGPQQFFRFAAPFRGQRDVWVLGHPGFSGGELIPANINALLELHVQTVLARFSGTPFVLVGLSSGGLVAQALAKRLEARGAGRRRWSCSTRWVPISTT